MQDISNILNIAREYDQSLPPLPELSAPPIGKQIAAWIDHTLLKPEATPDQIKSLCKEAKEHQFAAVCVNPCYAHLVSGLLAGSPVKVCTVIGFPLGATLLTMKAFEALSCLEAGSVEIDMVLNVGALKGEAYGQVLNDIQIVVQVAHNRRALVKVILETALLTRREKIIACLISQAAGADFVKTSTGFSTGGATIEDVGLMRCVVGSKMGVKASGGVRSYADALGMIKAGATRIGASSGVRILQEAEN